MRLLALCIAGFILAGCNSSQRDSAQREVKTYIVEIKQMKFVPDQIEVQEGDSIRWINRDIVAHNVADEASGSWRSMDLKTGESFIMKVNSAGSYKCTLHPVMKGKISLTNN